MTTVEQALRSLLDEKAAAGLLSPGAKLPTERELVVQLGASRGVVRRALGVLEAEGRITRHVGRGTFLAEPPPSPRSDAPPDTSPAEIMQVRLLLEPPVAGQAARLATRVDLDRIRRQLDAGGNSTDFESFEAADARFHRAIAEAAHNGLLMSIFDVMNTTRSLPIWGSLKRRTSSPERRRCYHEEHTAIADALSDRDPSGAHDAMRRHLAHVSANLLGS